MIKEKWAVLPEVTEATGGEITVDDLGLPYGMDLERIQVNIGALRRGVIGFGGYSALALTSYSGERDQNNASITSINSDGSASGVSAKTKSASSAEFESEDDRIRNSPHLRNGQLKVKVNSAALTDRASYKQQFDPGFKVKQISRAIKPELIKGVGRHNITGPVLSRRPISNVILGGVDGLYITDVMRSFMEKDYASLAYYAGVRVALLKLVMPAGNSIFYGEPISETISDYQLFSVRPTRAAIAAGVLASSRLLRETPLKTQTQE